MHGQQYIKILRLVFVTLWSLDLKRSAVCRTQLYHTLTCVLFHATVYSPAHNAHYL